MLRLIHVFSYYEFTILALCTQLPGFKTRSKYGTDDEYTICLIKNGLSLSSAMLLVKKYRNHLQIDISASTVVYGENLISEMIKAAENQIQIYEVQSCM